MTVALPTLGETVSLVCTVASTGAAVWVALRDGRWRKQGLFAKLLARIEEAERSAVEAAVRSTRWHETTEAKVLFSQVDQNSTRVARCEDRLDNVATKEDLARVQGALGSVEAVVKGAAAGVDRIESLLMRKAIG